MPTTPENQPTGDAQSRQRGPDARRRIHPAWLVAAVAFIALLAAAGFRAAPGALMVPLHADFGWSMSSMSLAVSVNLLLYGLTAPFAAALMDRFGIRQVVAAALTFVALGAGGSVLMTASWQLLIFWGVLIGLGTGSMALVFAATIADRWFLARRGLVMGILTAGSATGQLMFLPRSPRSPSPPAGGRPRCSSASRRWLRYRWYGSSFAITRLTWESCPMERSRTTTALVLPLTNPSRPSPPSEATPEPPAAPSRAYSSPLVTGLSGPSPSPSQSAERRRTASSASTSSPRPTTTGCRHRLRPVCSPSSGSSTSPALCSPVG